MNRDAVTAATEAMIQNLTCEPSCAQEHAEVAVAAAEPIIRATSGNVGGYVKHVLLGVGFHSQDVSAIKEIRRRLAVETDNGWAMHQSIALALADLLRGTPDGNRAFGGYPEEIRVILGDHAPWLLPGPSGEST